MAANWILDTPPRLCQKEIYKHEEAEMGCWATASEMVVKWKNKNAFFVRPKFAHKLPQNKSDIRLRSIIESTKSNNSPITPEEAENKEFLSRVGYMDFVRDWKFAWGFKEENIPMHTSWSDSQLVELLQNKGPLLCYGTFFPGGNSFQIGGQQHEIVVYGYTENFGGVYYIDPWDGLEKKMSLDTFNHKIQTINRDAICTRVTHWKNS